MPTERQSNASRANGAKSRGPVTAEGKRRSSQNARKVIDSDDLARYVCLEVENSAIFKNILEDLEATLEPQDPFARNLVHTIALAHWRSIRAVQLETAGMQQQMRKDLSLPETADLSNPTRAAVAFRTLADTGKATALLGRQEARHERQIARSFSMLMKWKASKGTKNEPDPGPSAPPPNPLETQEIPQNPPPPELAAEPKSEPEPTPITSREDKPDSGCASEPKESQPSITPSNDDAPPQSECCQGAARSTRTSGRTNRPLTPARRRALQLVHLVQRPRPILPRQPRKRPMRQKPPIRLTSGAIISHSIRMRDALHLRPAAGTTLVRPAPHRHGLLQQGLALRQQQPCNFLRLQLRRNGDGAKLRAMQDFVRIHITDPAQLARIGQRAAIQACCTSTPR